MNKYISFSILILILSSCRKDENQAVSCNDFNRSILGNWISTNTLTIVRDGNQKIRKFQEEIEFKEMGCGLIFKNDSNRLITDYCFNWKLNCDSSFIRVYEDLLCNELKGIALFGEDIWKIDSISKDRFQYRSFNVYESEGISWSVDNSCVLHRKK